MVKVNNHIPHQSGREGRGEAHFSRLHGHAADRCFPLHGDGGDDVDAVVEDPADGVDGDGGVIGPQEEGEWDWCHTSYINHRHHLIALVF